MLGQRFDSTFHEPVYLSRMLTLRESEFPRHADYVKEFRTCVIKSKVNTSDLQMGYLVNSSFVEGLSNDAVFYSTSLRFVHNRVQGDHLASTCFQRPLPRLTWQPVINLRKLKARPD